MSETHSPAAGDGGRSIGPLNYTNAAPPASSSGMVRLGGALGIAACVVGLVAFLAACLGVGMALALSIIPVALSVPGLVISMLGAVVQKRSIGEDTHVLHALFANVAGLIGGLLLMAVWREWPIFH